MSRLEAKTTAGPAVPHPFPYQGEQAGLTKFILPYFPPGIDRSIRRRGFGAAAGPPTHARPRGSIGMGEP